MWGQILSSMIGPAMEGISSAAQYQASKHERNIAWKRMGQWELISPSLRMAGLRAAGLNPVLAASSGFGGGGTNVPQASPGGNPSFDFDLGTVLSSAKQAKTMPFEIREAEARAKTAELVAEATKYLPEKAYNEAGAEGERWSQIRETVGLLREQQGATSAQAKRTAADTKLLESEIPAARALEDLYQRYPWLRQVGAVLKDTRR